MIYLMMAGQMLFVVAACLIISLSKAQNCSLADGIAYAFSLPNGLSCVLSFYGIDTTNATLGGMKALDKVCIAGCAGEVSEWLSSEVCNDTIQGTGLQLFCQPADNGLISRCRYALDLVDKTLFNSNDIRECDTVFNGTCPRMCDNGLKRLSEEIGCCYANIYNNTEVLNGLEENGDITGMEREFFTVLSNSLLWDACMVQIPETCTSMPFPVSVIDTVTDATTISYGSTTTDGSPTTDGSLMATGAAVRVYCQFTLATILVLSLPTTIF